MREEVPGRGRLLAACCAAVVAAAFALRLRDAWVAPVLAGYDAFGHFAYIRYVAETWRLPLPTAGWSFFHPPLYYALMAALWDVLAGVDPAVRLKLGKLLVAALGFVHPLAAWIVVGRALPGRARARWIATAAMLAIPVQLYSAGFLGNEGLHAVLGSLSLLALLAVLDAPTFGRSALLGILLGLAMLAKYSAVAIVAACLAAIAMQALATRRLLAGAKAFATTTLVLLAVCGPFYARNVAVYGRPFVLSRATPWVSYVEGNQPQAERGIADYLTFDPLIFRRPAWPRSSTPLSDPAPHGLERAMRESVWTGLYANTWFDGFGGWVLPPVVEDDAARHAGQLLLTLGLVPTLLMGAGLFSSLAAMRRRGWDAEAGSFALVTASMLVLFVYGTHEAPIAAAVKATYFTPICAVFALWLATGLEAQQRRLPSWTPAVDAACGLLALLSLVVFARGLVFDVARFEQKMPGYAEEKVTQYGVVEAAGGNLREARRAFEQAATTNYHLAIENLGFLAIDEGRTREGLALLRRAAPLQKQQVDGGPIGADRFLARAEADDLHSIAVVLHERGRVAKAETVWMKAIALDPTNTEALYSLAVSRLESEWSGTRDPAERRAILDEAARSLANVRILDPGMVEAWRASASVEALRGDCDSARRLEEQWRALPWWTERRFPAVSGTGDGFAASIGRRRLLTPKLRLLDPGQLMLMCGVAFD